MTKAEGSDARRRIPPVDRLLRDPRMSRLIGLYGWEQVRIQTRREVAALRARLAGADGLSAEELTEGLAALPAGVGNRLAAELGRELRRVINATGIFLHTNLGRAPLPVEVAHGMPALLDAACDLEMDLATGERSQRNRRAERLLRALTGAEAAVLVNNNAGALVLALAAMANGREVVVSRGELIEIGGSFRIPEMLTAAGARLVEVGTTNRTRLEDYARAIGPETALLLKVFPSNYRISGFVAAVDAGELVALGRERGVPVMVDEGSGLVRRRPVPQLADHPSLQELIAAGCDIVCGSGDKLLGGPQAGLLLGRREPVARCHRHPLYRALRPDRMAYAALEAVLRIHLTGAPLPLDRMWPDAAAARRRVEELARRLGAEVIAAEAFLGGGSAPEAPIPGVALGLPGDEALLRRLRTGEPPVVGYVREGRLVLDLRTVDPADDEALACAVEAAVQAHGPHPDR